MKRAFGLTGPALAILLMLAVPADLLAARWRGADILVAFRDGRQLRGELVAVKTEALVIQRFDTGVESVPVGEIKAVRLVRRSRVWQGLLGGFVAGAAGGAVWGGLTAGDSELGAAGAAILGGLIVAVPTSLVGLVGGLGAGLDDEIEIAGMTEPSLNNVLARLSRQAREPGAYIAPSRPGTDGGSKTELGRSLYDRRRFKLAWTPAYFVGGQTETFGNDPASFRFLEDLPPGEAGALTSHSYAYGTRSRFSMGRISLAYALNHRFAAEVELDHPGGRQVHRSLDMIFTSPVDGANYEAYVAVAENIRAVSLLAGVAFRPLLPGFLSPHAFELAVAAGPAWITSTRRTDSYDPDLYGSEVRRTRVWTARARASYEYRFAPPFSMGFSAEYRLLRTEIPTSTLTGDVTFQDSWAYDARTLTRLTEVTFPGLTLDWGGFGIGLTFGAHF